MTITRIKEPSTGAITYISHSTSFDTSAVPTQPVNLPVSPVLNDVLIEAFDNLAGSERAIMRWSYNGTTWVLSGHVEYNRLNFVSSELGTVDTGALPSAPVSFNVNLTTSYVPGDTLTEEFSNGTINWDFNGTTWDLMYAREYDTGGGPDTNTITSLRHETTFDTSAIPSTPTSPPGSPVTNDVVIQTYDNLTGTERATIRWTYNGTTWVQNGHVEYNRLNFVSSELGTVDTGALPANPVSFNTSLTTSYVVGDTLTEEFSNGYINWEFNGATWDLMYAREYSTGVDTNTITSIGVVASFDTSAIPTAPTVAPSSPTTNDVYIETFDNTTRNQAVIMRWEYNGTIWVLNGDPEYNTREFNVTVGATLDPTSLPSTPAVPGAATDYIPGDILNEEYSNGYMNWTYTVSGWSVNFGRVYTVNNLVTLGVVSSFNMNAVPTSPTVAPSSPKINDVYIETFNNTTRNQAATIRWTYNGTAWVINGVVELKLKAFFATVASNLTAGALPSTPATPGSSTGYLTGDTLHETYNNGTLDWTYGTSSWSLSASKIATNNTYVIKASTSWEEDGVLPASPENTPSTPIISDILIQSYNNVTRDNAVTRYWSWNGSAWVELSNGIHRFNMVFTNVPAVDLTYGVAPTASLAATANMYVNGDILWEKYTNGYGMYSFDDGAWVLLTYGLEVGRIQDSADFLATLGPGVDGWAVIYDDTLGGFTLADI